LFETVRATASCGELELELRSRPGQAARRARRPTSFRFLGEAGRPGL
jgi:hypothetical protein